MSAARKLQRAKAQAQQDYVIPPGALPPGAADLSHLSGGDRVQQQRVADKALLDNGFLCSCGQRFEADGILAVGYNLGRFPTERVVMTPQGPMRERVIDDGCQFFTATYHSRSCVNFLDALKNGMRVPEGVARPRIVAVRSVPAVEWLEAATHDYPTSEADATHSDSEA